MSEDHSQAYPAEIIFEDDPVLGAYVAHYVSDRRRLLLQGAALYIIPVIFLQLIFANTDGVAAALLLIALFGLLGLAVGWYVLHLWNREVVLYALGFTYREGSRLASFHYSNIVALRVRAERLAYLGFLRADRYQYTLRTNQDETISITNLYQDVQKLGPQLESFVTRARLPLLQAQLRQGQTLSFDALSLRDEGLIHDARQLAWVDFVGYRAESSRLILASQTDPNWASIPLSELDNLLLLVELLKSYRGSPASSGSTPA